MVNPSLLEQVTSLTVDEQVEFIGAVWDSLDQRCRAVTPADRQMLDDALEELEADPRPGLSAADSVARLRTLTT